MAAADARVRAGVGRAGRGCGGSRRRYAAALDHYLATGAADFDARAGASPPTWGSTDDVLGRPMTVLSGGQAARGALATILLSRFDVLLLDEPTNDLDFDGLDRARAVRRRSPRRAVVVSHDREFLERTVTRVLEIDEHRARARVRRRMGRLRRAARAGPARHAEEDYEKYGAASATGSRPGADAARVVGAGRARKAKNEAPSRTRTSARIPDRALREAGGQGARDRAGDRTARRGREAVGGMGSAAAVRRRRAQRRRRDAARRGGRATRGDFVLGPVDLEVGGASGSRSSGPTARGRRRCVRALLGRLPLDAGDRWIGPVVRRRARPGARPLRR